MKKSQIDKSFKLVYQANQLIFASYKLNLPARRIYLSLLANIDQRENIINRVHRLNIPDFSQMWNVSYQQTRLDLISGSRELLKNSIKISEPEHLPGIEELHFNWITEYRVIKNNKNIRYYYRFNDNLIYYIINLNKFIKCNINNYRNLKTVPATRLYELFLFYKNVRSFQFSIEELKYFFNAEDKYEGNYNAFYTRIIERALKNIEIELDIKIKTNPIKYGHKVVGLKFYWR